MESGLPASPALVEAIPSGPLYWVLVGVAAYWLALVVLRNRGALPSFVGTQGPILTIHTKRGRVFLDRLARPKRFWRAWANVGVGIALVVMVSMFLFLLLAAVGSLTSPGGPSSVQQPRNVLVIPGVNDFLPLSAAPGIVFGLLVGLVVHEGGHGLLCRVEDIDIDSMGVAMLAVIPMGAFVEPDQEDSKRATRGSQTRMFAAGVMNNFAITLVAFALLFGPVAGSIGVAPGAAVAGVAPGSPAEEADIEAHDRITAVDGHPVETNDDLADRLETIDAETVELELDGERTVTVERRLLVTVAVDGGPTDLRIGDEIVAVDGESISTRSAFFDAVGEDHRANLTVDREGQERVERAVPIGASVVTAADQPLAEAGAPTGEIVVVTAIDGERVHSASDLTSFLEGTDPGQTVAVVGYVDGERVEYEVTLDEHSDGGYGFLGINAVESVSGLALSDLGVQLYPAGEYLAILGGEEEGSFGPLTDTFLGKIVLALFLPVVGVVGYLPFNFAGFVGGVENFYQTQGALAGLGDGTVFLLANLLFWTGWINVQLGFFNCIPAFPLDGGHILRTSTEAVVSRLPFEATRGTVRLVTTTVGVTMLVSFLAMLFAPGLLS